MEAIVIRGPMAFDSERNGWLFKMNHSSNEFMLISTESLREVLNHTSLREVGLDSFREFEQFQNTVLGLCTFGGASATTDTNEHNAHNGSGQSHSQSHGDDSLTGTADGSNTADGSGNNSCSVFGNNTGSGSGSLGCMHADRLAMLILFLVELFSSDRVGLRDRDRVALAQDKYSSVLKRYVESRVTHERAKVLFPQLLLALMPSRRVAERLTRIATQIDWSNVEPLLLEMFSLR